MTKKNIFIVKSKIKHSKLFSQALMSCSVLAVGVAKDAVFLGLMNFVPATIHIQKRTDLKKLPSNLECGEWVMRL